MKNNIEKDVLNNIFHRVEQQLTQKEKELKHLNDRQADQEMFSDMHYYFNGAISVTENHIDFLKTILKVKDIYTNMKKQ